MAHQDGWPLGLRLLNGRIDLVEIDSDFCGSMLTASPTSSTDSSSDLESQATGSFFHDKTITLGSLIGVSSIIELSQRSTRGRIMVGPTKDNKSKKNKMMKPFLFSLCSKLTTDAVLSVKNDAPSLGHYLEAERRAANSTFRLNQYPTNSICGSNGFSPIQHSDSLSLLEQNNGYPDK